MLVRGGIVSFPPLSAQCPAQHAAYKAVVTKQACDIRWHSFTLVTLMFSAAEPSCDVMKIGF